MRKTESTKNPAAVALGSIKSGKKSESSRKNGKSWDKPHFRKCRHFEEIYPYPLVNNEWKDKFPVGFTPTGRVSTYNPDYYCPATGYYIEVTTSTPNIAAQRLRWSEAIRRGLKLKVFWWEGEDITEQFI